MGLTDLYNALRKDAEPHDVFKARWGSHLMWLKSIKRHFSEDTKYSLWLHDYALLQHLKFGEPNTEWPIGESLKDFEERWGKKLDKLVETPEHWIWEDDYHMLREFYEEEYGDETYD